MAPAGTTLAGQVSRALARRWRGLELLLCDKYYLMLVEGPEEWLRF